MSTQAKTAAKPAPQAPATQAPVSPAPQAPAPQAPALTNVVAPVADTRVADVLAALQQAELENAERTMYMPAPAARARVVMSAKEALRELFDVPGSKYTLAELVKATGKSEVNVRTQLSDMRSAKYAGKAGVYATSATRVAGVTYYSKS